MPWKECSVMDERMQFVARRRASEAMAELCREFEWSGRVDLNHLPPGPEPRNPKTISRFCGIASGPKPIFSEALN
jgi:hypothetical protein